MKDGKVRKIYVSIPSFEEFSNCQSDDCICRLSGEDLCDIQEGKAKLYSRETGMEILPEDWYCRKGGDLEAYIFKRDRMYSLFEQDGYVIAWRYDGHDKSPCLDDK